MHYDLDLLLGLSIYVNQILKNDQCAEVGGYL